MRIGLFKVGEERGVGEVLQAGGIVSHDIVSSWEEGCDVAVAMLSLMGTGVVAEMGGRADAGDSAAGHSGHGWCVVRGVGESGIAHIVCGGHQGSLG